LVERQLASSLALAQALILAGRVYTREVRIEKAGTLLLVDSPLIVRGGENPYVSRGGLKLQGALQAFAPLGLNPQGVVALDVGASTGGFTDCLLQAGAAKVYAVDVGYGQLHQKLRVDPRVVVRERTNARELEAGSFPEPISLITVDASFIGLAQLAPAFARVVTTDGALCVLIKPQFEASLDIVRKGKGVVRSEDDRQRAIASAAAALVQQGFQVIGRHDCDVKGPKGNHEHFVFARRSSVP